MKRRIFSLAIAFILVTTLLPTAAKAAEETINITGHTAGMLETEINDSMTDNGISSYEDITGLSVSGGTLNNVDRFFLYTSGIYNSVIIVDFSMTSIDYTGTVAGGHYSASNPNELPQNAFGNWISMKSIKLPDSVIRIEAFAFSGCAALETFYLPLGLNYIDYRVFYWSNALKDFYTNSTIPPAYLSDSAFENVASDAAIHVPVGSESNWDNKDWWPDNNKLFNIYVENMAPDISYIWTERTGETTAEIEVYINELGSSCYYEIVKDGEVVSNIDTSGTGTVNSLTLNLTGLEPVAYDIYVKAKDLRGNFSELVKIDLEAYVPPVDAVIINHVTGKLVDEIDDYLISLGIPDRYEKIQTLNVLGGNLNSDDWDIFSYTMVNNAKSIDLSETLVQSIPDYTFDGYGMTEIYLPSCIQSIGEGAFYECGNLSQITILSSTPPTVEEDAFYNLPLDAEVLVPLGSVAAYKAVNDGNTTDELWYGLVIREITSFTRSVIIQNDGNGTGSANLTSASQGQTVTLSATPNTNYHFKEWQILYPADLSIIGNSFTMPDGMVVIKAIFEADAVIADKSETDNTNMPETGDDGALWIVFMLLSSSAITLIGFAIYRRKNICRT